MVKYLLALMLRDQLRLELALQHDVDLGTLGALLIHPLSARVVASSQLWKKPDEGIARLARERGNTLEERNLLLEMLCLQSTDGFLEHVSVEHAKVAVSGAQDGGGSDGVVEESLLTERAAMTNREYLVRGVVQVQLEVHHGLHGRIKLLSMNLAVLDTTLQLLLRELFFSALAARRTTIIFSFFLLGSAFTFITVVVLILGEIVLT